MNNGALSSDPRGGRLVALRYASVGGGVSKDQRVLWVGWGNSIEQKGTKSPSLIGGWLQSASTGEGQ